MSSNKRSLVSVAVKRFKKEKCCAGLPKQSCPNIIDYLKEAAFAIQAKSKFVVEIYGIGNGQQKEKFFILNW